MVPQTQLSHLHRADGSATYSSNGYTIIGAVNGPIEVLRKDEIAEEATIEVHVRPAAGVGTPRYRHLETILHSALRPIVLVRSIPRSLVQITLQIRSTPDEEDNGSSSSSKSTLADLLLLPHLLHTSLLSLLSASIPLSTILTSTAVFISSTTSPLISPTLAQIQRTHSRSSLHVFAFSGKGSLLLNESAGIFEMAEWDEACEMALEACVGDGEEGEGGVRIGEGMEVDGVEEGEKGEKGLEEWIRSVVGEKVKRERKWRGGD